MAFVPFRMAQNARLTGRSRTTLRSTQRPADSGHPQHQQHPSSASRPHRNGQTDSQAHSGSGAAAGESTAPNLTRHATGGLRQLYDRIRQKDAHRHQQHSSSTGAQQQQQQHNSQPQQSPRLESFTRHDGHLQLSDALPLLNNRYRIISAVGEGTFSQLVLAEDTFAPLPASAASHHTAPPPSSSSSALPLSSPAAAPGHKRVALKIMNSKYSFIGLQEVEKLCWLNGRDAHQQSHIVRLLGAFYFQQHLCLVLELLGASLLSFMKQQPQHRVPMETVRKIAWQLLISLAFVGSCNMIHGDIKPENVLLTNSLTLSLQQQQQQQPQQAGGNGNSKAAAAVPSPKAGFPASFASPSSTASAASSCSLSSSSSLSSAPPAVKSCSIKLVDFGNAMTGNEASLYFDDFDVQTLYYRAPEVLLGVGFGAAIDMWSLGCVLMELSTGKPLFHVSSNRELFGLMIRTLGPLPVHPFRSGKFASKYLSSKDYTYTPSSAAPAAAAASSHFLTSQPNTSEYYHLFRLNNIAKLLSSRDRDYVSFILGLLEFDPQLRLTPTQALFHPFFARLTPLSLLFGDSANVQPAVAAVARMNTKQTPQHLQQQQQQQVAQQQQQQETWTAYHPSLIATRQLHPPAAPPPAAAALPASGMALQPAAHLSSLRSPYLPGGGRTIRSDAAAASPMLAAAYPLSSPLTSASFPVHTSPALFSSSPTEPNAHRLLHPTLLSTEGGIQQLLSPSTAAPPLLSVPGLPFPSLSLPLIASTGMETYYPTALSSFYSLQHPSTPILTARPPPVLPRFPGSPDLLFAPHALTQTVAASPPATYSMASPRSSAAFSPHFLSSALTPVFTPVYASPASATPGAASSPSSSLSSLHQLQQQQAALVESSLAFDSRQPSRSGNTPLTTPARRLTQPALAVAAAAPVPAAANSSAPAGNRTLASSPSAQGGAASRSGRARGSRGAEEKMQLHETQDVNDADAWGETASGTRGRDGGRSKKRRKRAAAQQQQQQQQQRVYAAAEEAEEQKQGAPGAGWAAPRKRGALGRGGQSNGGDDSQHGGDTVDASGGAAVFDSPPAGLHGIPPTVLARLGLSATAPAAAAASSPMFAQLQFSAQLEQHSAARS